MPAVDGRRRRKTKRWRWADRDTYLSLFWLGVGFAAGVYQAGGSR